MMISNMMRATRNLQIKLRNGIVDFASCSSVPPMLPGPAAVAACYCAITLLPPLRCFCYHCCLECAINSTTVPLTICFWGRQTSVHCGVRQEDLPSGHFYETNGLVLLHAPTLLQIHGGMIGLLAMQIFNCG